MAHAGSFVTEMGELCGQCFAKFQNEQAARASVAAHLERRLSSRMKRVAFAHGVIWAVTFILTADAMRIPDGVGGAMFVAALVLMMGLGWRQRWAYLAALALDWPGTVALMILGATSFKPGRAWIAILVPPFTIAIGYAAWHLRGAYASRASLDARVN